MSALTQYHSDSLQWHSGVLVGSRILCFSPNISMRLYPQWAQRVLNVPALPKGEVHRTNDPVETTVSGGTNDPVETTVSGGQGGGDQ